MATEHVKYTIGFETVEAPGETSSYPRAAYLIAGGLLMLTIALGAYFIAQHLLSLSRHASGQAMAGKASAELLQKHLHGELLGITRTLGEENSAMKAAATGRTEPDAPEVIATLSRVRQATRATIVYIMNARGDTVACTPYEGGQTLTGNNYAFRPYFKTAVRGRDVVYPALGVTTQKRGLYFSSPIRAARGALGEGPADGAAIGAVVVKKGLEEVDGFFQSFDQPAALLTPEGVVFAGNRPDWLLHPFSSGEKKSDDRQFGAGDQPVDTVVRPGAKPFHVLLQQRPYHMFISDLRLPGSEGTWRLVFLEDLSTLLPGWFRAVVLISSLAGLCAVAAGSVLLVRRQRGRPRLQADNMLAATAVACMGSLLFLAIHVVVEQWEERRIKALFINKAEATAAFLTSGVKGYLSELDTLTHFADTMAVMDRDRLAVVAAPILARKEGIESVLWAPKQEDGPARTRRFPVALRQPPSATSFDLGFDLAADGRFAATFDAISTGIPGTAGLIPIKLHDDPEHVRMAAVAPVYAEQREGDQPAGRSFPRGVMVTILDIAQALDGILSVYPQQGLYIRVTDLVAGANPLPLYDSGPPAPPGKNGGWMTKVQLEHRISMAVGERSWQCVVTGGPEFIDLHQNHYGPAILIVGAVLTLAAASFVASSARRRQQVERLVENRTAQLAESENRISTILESIQAGVVIIDIARKSIEYVNRAAAQMAGWHEDELKGRTCHLLICPNPQGRCPVADLKQTTGNAERLLLRKDGSSMPVMKTVKPITFKGRPCFIETFVDITALTRAQEALGRSERNYRLLFESATDAVFLLDNNVISDANQTALDMFGLARRDQLVGRHPADLSPMVQPCGTESYVLIQQRLQAAHRQKDIRFEWLHKRQDGETFPAEVVLKPLELGGRRVIQVVIRDISERKAHDDRLAETLRELERFNKVMQGREGRVLELKAEVNALMAELGRTPTYRTAGAS